MLRLPLLLLLAWLIFLVAAPVVALNDMAMVPESSSGGRPAGQPGTAILLVGTDERPPGEEQLDSVRADTIMLLYRPPTGRSVLVSLPRDSYVTIPGHGDDKLNASYAYGGPALLIDTVESATGVRIDGYLEIGFAGFAGLVDAVGGVEVCIDAPIVDELSKLDLPVGCHTLDGTTALAYVRMRYSDPRGDIGRAERQRQVIGATVAKAATPASVINPIRYWKLNQAAAQMLKRGDDTGLFDLAGGGLGLMNIATQDGLSLVVPIANPAGWSPSGASVVIWDDQNAAALFGEIASGDTSALDRFAG